MEDVTTSRLRRGSTGAEYDDDGVDVGDVDGDDGGVIYYYCDYYSQSVLDCYF